METSKYTVARPAIRYLLVTAEGSVRSDARINSGNTLESRPKPWRLLLPCGLNIGEIMTAFCRCLCLRTEDSICQPTLIKLLEKHQDAEVENLGKPLLRLFSWKAPTEKKEEDGSAKAKLRKRRPVARNVKTADVV